MKRSRHCVAVAQRLGGRRQMFGAVGDAMRRQEETCTLWVLDGGPTEDWQGRRRSLPSIQKLE
jgi:hypothetical protein